MVWVCWPTRRNARVLPIVPYTSVLSQCKVHDRHTCHKFKHALFVTIWITCFCHAENSPLTDFKALLVHPPPQHSLRYRGVWFHHYRNRNWNIWPATPTATANSAGHWTLQQHHHGNHLPLRLHYHADATPFLMCSGLMVVGHRSSFRLLLFAFRRFRSFPQSLRSRFPRTGHPLTLHAHPLDVRISNLAPLWYPARQDTPPLLVCNLFLALL